MKQTKVKLVGGPLAGWGEGVEDGYYGDHGDVVQLYSGGDPFVYRRVGLDGEREVWHWDEAATMQLQGVEKNLILSSQVGKTEGDKANTQEVTCTYNEFEKRWELKLGEEVVDVKRSLPDNAVERRMAAVEWLRSVFPDAEGRMTGAA